jgi:hypothetical protein
MMSPHFLYHYPYFVVLALHVIAIVTVMKLSNLSYASRRFWTTSSFSEAIPGGKVMAPAKGAKVEIEVIAVANGSATASDTSG